MKQLLGKALKNHPLMYDYSRMIYGMFSNERYPLYKPIKIATNKIDKPLRFLQLGASDGRTNDPFRALIFEQGWTGVQVEPIEESYIRLKNNNRHMAKRLIFINAAVSYGDDKAILYRFSESIYPKISENQQISLLQKTSFDPDHLKKYISEIDVFPEFTSFEIKAFTVENLVKEYFPNGIDLLCMDLEGYEVHVFRGINLSLVKPKIIVFEWDHFLENDKLQVIEKLESNGYKLIDLQTDCIAIL